MPCLQIIRQAARSLGNDLEAARDGVYGLEVALESVGIETHRETGGEFDMVQDIAKGCVVRPSSLLKNPRARALAW